MYHDVVDLNAFYQSRLGEMARQLIRRAVRSLWPDLTGKSLLGVGYANPYLRQFKDEAERVLSFMPAPQGVIPWPPEGPNCVSLCEETELPLPDYSVDRVLLVHGLEHSEYLRELLREVWRVLAGDGRLLVVVPNRRGIWARSDRSPFGWGQPYSPPQLSRLLREHHFIPERGEQALFIPPTRSAALLKAAVAWERIGQRNFPRFSGVVLVDSGKQLFVAKPEAARRRLGRRALVGIAQPQPASRAALSRSVEVAAFQAGSRVGRAR